MKKIYIFLIGLIIFSIALQIMYRYGLFHGAHSWEEYKFSGMNIEALNNHLKNKEIDLELVTYHEGTRFQHLTGKTLAPSQELYRFWGGRDHSFWWFPIGTKTYGMYVLVDDEKIVFLQECVSVDSL